jgi:hypothetical protein
MLFSVVSSLFCLCQTARLQTTLRTGRRHGDLLTLTAEAGVVIARRDPGGMVTVPTRPGVVMSC